MYDQFYCPLACFRGLDAGGDVTQSTTFHDVLDPLGNTRVSLRLAGGVMTERAETLTPGAGTDIDGSALWLLPALYDADAHFPLQSLGLRASDIHAAMQGGVAHLNVALQWQEIEKLDLASVVAELMAATYPRITPILSVHSDLASDGFDEWLARNAATVKALLPPVCKLYSYSANFWSNLDSVFAAGLRPIIYCKDMEAVEGVVARATAPVHFRHAISSELVNAMKKLPGATLQTSPHFLLALDSKHRTTLNVLPPVPDDDVRTSLLDVFLKEIDLLVSDHNAPPFGAPDGPGLQVEQSFLSSILTAISDNDWPLDRVWEKATTAASSLYGQASDDAWVIVDPDFEQTATLWPPRQTPERAPYLGRTLRGRVIAIGAEEMATLV
jgi:dihydroorotase-like cyclic amidohydrolase